jgi:hypothetical protein
VGESLEGVLLPALLGDLALLQLLEELMVVLGVAEDGDTAVVLCGGAKKGDSSNVNLLDGLGDGHVDLVDGVLEGVQVADNVVDLVDVLVGQVLLVRGKIASEYAGVDSRVEGLDAAREHLGGLCDGGDIPRRGCQTEAHPMALTQQRTHSTGKPASLIILDVPPDASRRTFCLTRPLARSSRPVLL